MRTFAEAVQLGARVALLEVSVKGQIRGYQILDLRKPKQGYGRIMTRARALAWLNRSRSDFSAAPGLKTNQRFVVRKMAGEQAFVIWDKDLSRRAEAKVYYKRHQAQYVVKKKTAELQEG